MVAGTGGGFPHLVLMSKYVEFCDFFLLRRRIFPAIMGKESEVNSKMRELYLKTLRLPDETGTTRSYDYSIIIDEMDVGPYSCESYGIKVAEQGGAEACASHVTCSAARIDELSDLLLRNGVTPITFHDVLSDWL